MPDLAVPLSPTETLNRIEAYARDWRGDRLPQTIRDKNVEELTLVERTGDRFRIHFMLKNNTRLVQYCEGQVAPDAAGSIIHCTLRGRFQPLTAFLLVFALVCMQIVYELFTGEFDRFTVGVAVILPSFSAFMAHTQNRVITSKYGAGMLDALRLAVADTLVLHPGMEATERR